MRQQRDCLAQCNNRKSAVELVMNPDLLVPESVLLPTMFIACACLFYFGWGKGWFLFHFY